MIIRITSDSGKMPSYETEGSAGMDLRAFVDESLVLKPGERKLIPTGIRIELPPGYEAQIRPRSGLAVSNGIGMVNGVGTIDSDYRGEIKIPLINWGSEDFKIDSGDRIAQLVVARYERVQWQNVELLEETKRGTGGFGHTGK